MNLKVLCFILFNCVLSFGLKNDCNASNCLLEDGCLCPSRTSPLPVEETPQFVVISFDDAVTEDSFNRFYSPLFYDRFNPDGSHVSGSFYIPHKYTNYAVVNKLYNEGFEIGVHTVSKEPIIDYWANASLEILTKEFADQKEIIHIFANIPKDDITGARTPHLQMAGNKTVEALIAAELKYDNSWNTLTTSPWFPYTLDFSSPQGCYVGQCPYGVYPNFTIAPINNLHGYEDIECTSVFGCRVGGQADNIFEWLVNQFERIYTNTKLPQSYLLSSAWFTSEIEAFEGFSMFLDYLGLFEDVYLVSNQHVLDWMMDPIPLANYTVPVKTRDAACGSISCPLEHGIETMYMVSCIPCPFTYPWLGNPSGGLRRD